MPGFDWLVAVSCDTVVLSVQREPKYPSVLEESSVKALLMFGATNESVLYSTFLGFLPFLPITVLASSVCISVESRGK